MEKFDLQLSIENFNCSESWSTRLKERNGLVFHAVSSKSAAADASVCQSWQERRLQEILREFKPEDVSDIDKAALFFKLFLTKSFSLKSEHCTGGKFSKERPSVLIGANMNESNKLQPLVIAKSK